ncbi:hypothetical protein BD410DRAFT_363920 [Rickenella mellea]|uniref:Ser-Thr-rich glycosyl-phosphatidyl-inositol-anchored membrane family-domain-containing protein n=1 Tax=Rickenella mellea TaxID=50990 RepID=A0A4Y7Q090_9AGAM|nr:hypothetical protein BD410DRAFT_363920 [Rickenella mellea]
MKSFCTLLALAAFLAQVYCLTVTTPTDVVECQPIQFTWTDSTPPYFLSLLSGGPGQTSAPAIKQFPQQSGTSYTWLVDLPANTQFTIVLKDSSGTEAFSDAVTIQDGGNRTCENTAVQETGGGTGAGASTTPSATGGSTTPDTAPKASGTVPSAPSPSPSKSNGVLRSGSLVGAVALGMAGVMGLVGAASAFL